jgi:hypothetical protein
MTDRRRKAEERKVVDPEEAGGTARPIMPATDVAGSTHRQGNRRHGCHVVDHEDGSRHPPDA